MSNFLHYFAYKLFCQKKKKILHYLDNICIPSLHTNYSIVYLISQCLGRRRWGGSSYMSASESWLRPSQWCHQRKARELHQWIVYHSTSPFIFCNNHMSLIFISNNNTSLFLDMKWDSTWKLVKLRKRNFLSQLLISLELMKVTLGGNFFYSSYCYIISCCRSRYDWHRCSSFLTFLTIKHLCRKQRYVYCTILDSIAKVKGIIKFDLEAEPESGKEKLEVGGNVSGIFDLGPGRYGSEAIFVPRQAGMTGDEDDGYLIFFVHDENTGYSLSPSIRFNLKAEPVKQLQFK